MGLLSFLEPTYVDYQFGATAAPPALTPGQPVPSAPPIAPTVIPQLTSPQGAEQTVSSWLNSALGWLQPAQVPYNLPAAALVTLPKPPVQLLPLPQQPQLPPAACIVAFPSPTIGAPATQPSATSGPMFLPMPLPLLIAARITIEPPSSSTTAPQAGTGQGTQAGQGQGSSNGSNGTSSNSSTPPAMPLGPVVPIVTQPSPQAVAPTPAPAVSTPAPVVPVVTPAIPPPAVSPAPPSLAADITLRAWCYSPMFHHDPSKQLAHGCNQENEGGELKVTHNASPLTFEVLAGCNRVDLLYGPIEVAPEGSARDLDHVIATGKAKLSVDGKPVDLDAVTEGDQISVTVPWRSSARLNLEPHRLRMLVLARFYSSSTLN